MKQFPFRLLFISVVSLLTVLHAEITATISPAELTIAVGETANFEFRYSCSDGETLYSYFLPIERKDAPQAFFAKTTHTINRHATNEGYDNIFLVPYAVMNPRQGDGVIQFSIPLNDFVPGSYEFSFRARFMKNEKEINDLYPVKMTVTPQMPPVRRALAKGEIPNLEDYLIYCDEEATPSVKSAAKELQEFIQKASGTKLPIYKDPLPPFIAVGASKIAKDNGIDGDALPEDGYVLKTIDNNLFIVGREMPNDGRTKMYGHSFGTRAGVRAFLEKHLGIMWLLPGERGQYIPKRSPKTPLPQLDEQYAPFFQYRLHWPICGRTQLINQWLEFNMGEHIGSRYDGAPHSWIWLYPTPNMPEAKAVLDRESTFRKNPNLFELSRDGKRVMPNAGEVFSLCLGNPETTEDIIDRIVKLNILRDELEPEFKGLRFQSLTPSDTCPNCACEACQKGRHDLDPKEIGTMAYELGESWTELVFESDRIICERLP
ncbi:MAG: hypothetical protein MJ106_03110, partial [Lentisphaeria bacterium]|nr:hypothetical protein [Lentisphaeria bacterium]